MKQYEIHYVERGGFPGSCFAWEEAGSDKAMKESAEPFFNQSANRGHCGIRIFRMPERKCIFKKFYHA